MNKPKWQHFYEHCNCVLRVPTSPSYTHPDKTWVYFFREGVADMPLDGPGAITFQLHDNGKVLIDYYGFYDDVSLYTALDAYRKYNVLPSSYVRIGKDIPARINEWVANGGQSRHNPHFEEIQAYFLDDAPEPGSYFGDYCIGVSSESENSVVVVSDGDDDDDDDDDTTRRTVSDFAGWNFETAKAAAEPVAAKSVKFGARLRSTMAAKAGGAATAAAPEKIRTVAATKAMHKIVANAKTIMTREVK